jgi:pyridoxamine 5'-phosphate oxidase
MGGLINAAAANKVRSQMAVDPFIQFQHWFTEAQRAGIRLPEAMALATADAKGQPAVRFVLLKSADERGFVFFTNIGSRKGRELYANPRASLAFYWDEILKQVRVDGQVEPVAPSEVDAYWATRPRESQLAARASRQSATLASRAQLLARWETLRHRYRDKDVPRPAGWVGYRLVPETIEFWTHRDHRLHDRELFVRTRGGWKRKLLQP